MAPPIVGMLVGLAGTLLLVAPEALQEGFGGPLLRGFLLLQIGCAGWALGSILQRRHQTKAHPVVSGAVQQLATGLAFAVPALFAKPHPSTLERAQHRSGGLSGDVRLHRGLQRLQFCAGPSAGVRGQHLQLRQPDHRGVSRLALLPRAFRAAGTDRDADHFRRVWR